MKIIPDAATLRSWISSVGGRTQSTAVLTHAGDEAPKTCDPVPKETEYDVEVLCGMGSFRPAWLQRAANPKLFLFVYSLTGLLSGAQFTYTVGCMTTLEKRFAYDTKTSGFINMTDEIGPIILGLFVGYFGGVANRPKLLAFGTLITALSCFVFSLPYFLYGALHLDDISSAAGSVLYQLENQCKSSSLNVTEERCEAKPTLPAVSLFLLGNFVKGVAVVIFTTVGTAYLDDSVKKKNSPGYLATMMAFRLLGPALGFILSSFCLRYYEDPFYDPGFSTKDPRWIGAWWLGFIVIGVATIVCSALLIMFPRRFPGKKLHPSLSKQKQEDERKTPLQQLKGMAEAVKRIYRNPILMCHFLGSVFRLNGIIGYYVLLPKYMEMQFKQSASKASLYSGPVSIVGMQIGILLSGFVIRKWQPRPRLLTGGIVFAEAFSVASLALGMLITCPTLQMPGTTQMANQQAISLQNECNVDCMCTTKVYTPVCGPDGKSTYFSPCFAGCAGHNKTDGKEVFTDCKCVFDAAGDLVVGDAQKGYCGSECQWMVTYVVVLAVAKLLSSTSRLPNMLVVLRSVDPQDKTLALGALNGAASLFAFIPYPLIYGALTDASCLIWEKSCGKTGNCWVYDVDKFRFLLHGVSAMFVFLGTMTDVIVWILSPRLKNLYNEDDDSDDPKADSKTTKTGGMKDVGKTDSPDEKQQNPSEKNEQISTSTL